MRAARSVLEQWVETRRLISKEEREWTLGKEILDDRIALLGEQEAKVLALIEDAESSTAEAAETEAKLVAELDELQASSKNLTAAIAGLEARVKETLKRVPEIAIDTLNLGELIRRVPDDPSSVEEGDLGQRYQNVVGILDALNKFHGEIHLLSDMVALGDGSSAQVQVIWVGLGAGYYVTQDGLRAGVAELGKDGWTWRAQDASAPVIAEMVAMLENRQPAAFLSAPVEIR